MKRLGYLLLLTMIVVGMLVALPYFGCKGKHMESGISRDQAIKIAIQRVQADGIMSLDGRSTAVIEEPNSWHISFPISAPNMRGGEPHVIIDKASGAITRVYYTQ